jgi:hypothetical protein
MVGGLVLSSQRRWPTASLYRSRHDGEAREVEVGAPASEQPKLQPLLDALRRLRDGGLTVVEVAAAFHRRHVLSLKAQWLCLDEMEEASLEGCRMSDASLSTTEVTRRVAYMLAAGFTVAELNQVRMHPTWGYISLVSMTNLLMFSLFSTGLFLCY